MGWLVVLASACSLALGIYVIVRQQMTRPGLAVVASGWLLLAVPCLTARNDVSSGKTTVIRVEPDAAQSERIAELTERMYKEQKELRNAGLFTAAGGVRDGSGGL